MREEEDEFLETVVIHETPTMRDQDWRFNGPQKQMTIMTDKFRGEHNISENNERILVEQDETMRGNQYKNQATLKLLFKSSK